MFIKFCACKRGSVLAMLSLLLKQTKFNDLVSSSLFVEKSCLRTSSEAKIPLMKDLSYPFKMT